MPYPNEHSARILSPGSCTEKYRRKDIAPGISLVLCQLKANTEKWATQTYRFKKDKFTAAQARKWLKDHDIRYTLFEAATD